MSVYKTTWQSMLVFLIQLQHHKKAFESFHSAVVVAYAFLYNSLIIPVSLSVVIGEVPVSGIMPNR